MLLLTHLAFHLLSARSPSPGFQRRAGFEPSTSAVFESFTGTSDALAFMLDCIYLIVNFGEWPARKEHGE